MGRLHLRYIEDNDYYYECRECSTHIASINTDSADHLILGGITT